MLVYITQLLMFELLEEGGDSEPQKSFRHIIEDF